MMGCKKGKSNKEPEPCAISITGNEISADAIRGRVKLRGDRFEMGMKGHGWLDRCPVA
jgi:hypothetical protein